MILLILSFKLHTEAPRGVASDEESIATLSYIKEALEELGAFYCATRESDMFSRGKQWTLNWKCANLYNSTVENIGGDSEKDLK